MQTLQAHVPGALVGALSPAAPQLNTPDEFVGAVPADSGRGSSHAPHLVLAELLLIIQTGHFHESAAFIGAFIPEASQLKPEDTGTGFAPKANVNVGSEHESATKAASRSLA